MTQEEKAKAYDEALEKARKYRDEEGFTEMEDLFPELAENEDEKIWRELVEYLKGDLDDVTTDDTDRWINWLEKQKKLFESGRGLYYYDGEKTIYCGYPATEQKDYRKLYEDIAQSEWFKKAYAGKSLGEEQKPIDPCDASWYAYYRRGYERGLEVGRKEQKPVEWSEEDESYLQTVINEIKANKKEAREYEHKKYDAIILWLKSLRPSWKPSEAHLSALLAVFNDPDNIGSQTCQLALTDLYEQLKAIKEDKK